MAVAVQGAVHVGIRGIDNARRFGAFEEVLCADYLLIAEPFGNTRIRGAGGFEGRVRAVRLHAIGGCEARMVGVDSGVDDTDYDVLASAVVAANFGPRILKRHVVMAVRCINAHLSVRLHTHHHRAVLQNRSLHIHTFANSITPLAHPIHLND
jgi:hypothetical protein